MKGYSISWYSSDEEQGNPRFAHRSALPCGKKLYLVSTAAIWWLDGLLDLAQLCSLSCPLKVLWGHWDAGEEPRQKMESPPGSPLSVGRLTRPEKSQLCALPALPTPPLILPDSSVSVPRLGFLPTHQSSGPQTQCCVPLSARPWHLRPCRSMTHLT